MCAAEVVSDPAPPSDSTRPLHPLALWTAVAAAVLVVQFVAGFRHGKNVELGSGLLDGLNQFDGPEYLRIASEGYQARQLVWFPLYPLLIAALTVVVRDPLLAAVLISLAASAAAALLCWRWLEAKGVDGARRTTALAALLLYPYAWFLYGAVYADALFLALCLGAFLALEKDRRVIAAVAAAAATATRPSGFALVIGLLVVALERDGVLTLSTEGAGWIRRLHVPSRVDLQRLRAATLWPLAGLGGLAAYGAYQWFEWGSPLRFSTEQGNYHEPGTASALKQQFFAAFYEGFDARHLATTTFQAVILAAVVLAVPAVGRRFGWGYATYCFGLALLPAVSVSTFMGVGRYLLPAFPVFALVGEWLADRPGLRAGWLAASGGLMLLMTFGFARSWYLS
jgi:hypothetical protein